MLLLRRGQLQTATIIIRSSSSSSNQHQHCCGHSYNRLTSQHSCSSYASKQAIQ
jgi:hypothetical protein